MVDAALTVRAEGAEVRRAGKRLVGPVDLSIEGQGITMIIGPNGAGKTTLLRMLHGMERLSGGSLEWNVPLDEARKRQAFVFQTPIMMRRTVRDSLIYPLALVRTPRRAAQTEAEAWAARIGLADALERRASDLSGGERQKLALARALIRKPDLLFLDEPCASLDGRATREIEEILHDAASGGTRLVMSTHDMGQARRLAREVVFLLHGRLHETGAAAEILTAPNTAELSAFLKGDIVE